MTTLPTQSDSHVCRERTHHSSLKKIGEKCDDRDFPLAISPHTVRCPTPTRRVREDRQQPADPDRGDVLRVRLHRSDDNHKSGTLQTRAECDYFSS